MIGLEHLGGDGSGGNAVDLDVIGRQIQRPTARQTHHRRLARRIRCAHRPTDNHAACNIDDAAVTAGLEMRQQQLGQLHQGAQIDLIVRIHFFHRHCLDGSGARQAGVIDQPRHDMALGHFCAHGG